MGTLWNPRMLKYISQNPGIRKPSDVILVTSYRVPAASGWCLSAGVWLRCHVSCRNIRRKVLCLIYYLLYVLWTSTSSYLRLCLPQLPFNITSSYYTIHLSLLNVPTSKNLSSWDIKWSTGRCWTQAGYTLYYNSMSWNSIKPASRKYKHWWLYDWTRGG